MFVTALLAATLAAPVPKAKPAELYFPTVEGTKRVMQLKTGDSTSETTEVVSKVTEKDGKFTVTISRDFGGRVIDIEYEVSAKGVFAVSDPNGKLAEPEPRFKLPAKEGDSWTVDRADRQRKRTGTATLTVGKEEEVEVPAGKFKAIPVTTESDLGGAAVKGTVWYAAGVGVVKTATAFGGTDRVQELKEFTPGKAK